MVVVCCFDLADNYETKLSGNEWNVYIGKGYATLYEFNL